MVHKYRKGYVGERELVFLLHNMGYMVVRTPRSGRVGLASPDIIAAKNGKLIVIECKSRKNAFTIPLEQLNELKEWEEKGGAKAYIGWKITRKGWIFLNLDDVVKNKGNIGKKFAEKNGIEINSFL
ncbi:MAG: Holliday junction resolvase Hjc [Candidatus Aenigmatarchaeota archaeon]